MAGSDPQSAKKLSQFAENLLQQLHENFEDLTDKLSLKNILFRSLSKIMLFNLLLDEMGERINDLEKHVAELMAEAGIENANGDSER
ncbi:heat shock factor-binding protein 1-like protein 1 [Vipera latastei]